MYEKVRKGKISGSDKTCPASTWVHIAEMCPVYDFFFAVKFDIPFFKFFSFINRLLYIINKWINNVINYIIR